MSHNLLAMKHSPSHRKSASGTGRVISSDDTTKTSDAETGIAVTFMDGKMNIRDGIVLSIRRYLKNIFIYL